MNTKIRHILDRVNIVGVIASSADLKLALADPHIADIYEWRVDYYQSADVEHLLRMLRKPIIVTVRDQSEGGLRHDWGIDKRVALYLQYMPIATFVDIEASTASALVKVIKRAKDAGVGVIISQHVFDTAWAPTLTDRAAEICVAHEGDLFKTVLLPDGPAEFYQFMSCVHRLETTYFSLKIAPMAIGKQFGKTSRVLACMNGSPLVYGSLNRPAVEGQWRVSDIREILDKVR